MQQKCEKEGGKPGGKLTSNKHILYAEALIVWYTGQCYPLMENSVPYCLGERILQQNDLGKKSWLEQVDGDSGWYLDWQIDMCR